MKNKKMPLIQLDFHSIKFIVTVILIFVILLCFLLVIISNFEQYGTYTHIYNCSQYQSKSISEISSVRYNSKMRNDYYDKIYNYSGKIYNIKTDGDHPYFQVDWNGIKIYINKNELKKLKDKKVGDEIYFCGIIVSSKKDILKIENATITN